METVSSDRGARHPTRQRGKQPGSDKTHRLYTQTSPLAAHREHDGLAPLHLTCQMVSPPPYRDRSDFGICPNTRAPTLRLRQASHEKALFRGSAVFRGTSAMSELEPSTTIGRQSWVVRLGDVQNSLEKRQREKKL